MSKESLKNLLSLVVDFWQVIVSLVIIVGFAYQSLDKINYMDAEIKRNYKDLKNYVDNQNAKTNTKISFLENNINILNQQLIESNNKISSNLNKIITISRENNGRLDKIWTAIYSSSKK